MTFSLALTQAPQHSYYNGGITATARQYYLRPTQHTPNGSRIAAAVSGMVAGEFRTIWANNADFVFSVHLEETGVSYPSLDWTPRAIWHEPTQQIIIGGRRGSYKYIAYSDVTGDWRELAMHPDMGRNTGGTAHYYGMITQDDAARLYVGHTEKPMFRLEPETETWTRIADHLLTNGSNGSMWDWSPHANGGTGGVIKYGGDAKRWLIYNPATDTWTNPYNTIGNGQHALLAYNPTAQRFLLVGGSLTLTRAMLVTNEGVATLVTSCPAEVTMSPDGWVMYHPAGCWLVRSGQNQRLYACWPNAEKTDVTWQDLGASPDAGLTYPTVAADYDRGLIYIVSTTGLHAYKLPEVTDPSGAVAISPQGAKAHFSGAIPGIAQPRALSPVAGQAQATGHAPAVLQGDAQAIAPQAGHAQAHGYAPTLAQPLTIAPSKGSITATGYAPTAEQTPSVRPQAGRIAAHGYAPTIGQAQTIAPTRAQAVATGHTPIVVKGVRVDPQTGRVDLAGHAPTITQGGARTVTPAVGRVRAMGWAPSVTTMPIGGYPSSVTITVPAGRLLSAASGRTITLRPR